MKTENVKLNPGFTQVCVWPATELGDNTPAKFEQFIKDTFGVRAQYLENIKTNPDIKKSVAVPGTGGRDDLFFAIHNEDLGKFAIPRLQYGIRWIEDVYGNGRGYIYPKRVKQYKSW